MSENDQLKSRIQELENEVRLKDAEIQRYRTEMIRANHALESLTGTLSEQIKMASLIQKKLSPTEFPNISGMEFSSKFIPGMKSGGDYFDIFELEDRFRFAVILASSSGYGLSALLMSVILKLSGRLEARKGLPPHEVVQILAHDILKENIGEHYASIFYAIIDRRTFEAEYTVVGTVQSYLLPQNEPMKDLSLGLAPIKKGFVAPTTSARFLLNPRDRFILFTDGVLQTKNLENQELGLEGAQNIIKKAPKTGVHDLRNELLFQLEKFSSKTEFDRDISVIVSEVKDKVIKLTKK